MAFKVSELMLTLTIQAQDLARLAILDADQGKELFGIDLVSCGPTNGKLDAVAAELKCGTDAVVQLNQLKRELAAFTENVNQIMLVPAAESAPPKGAKAAKKTKTAKKAKTQRPLK